jgi:hypothetical protein
MKAFYRLPAFWVGFFIKFFFLFFLGSSYLRELFIPFVDQAVRSFPANPWTLLPPEHFPYGSVLLALLFVPKFIAFHLFGETALGVGAFSLFLIKLPLLILDIGFLFYLARFCGARKGRLVYYYWLNPVIFTVNWMSPLCLLAWRRFSISPSAMPGLSRQYFLLPRLCVSSTSWFCSL